MDISRNQIRKLVIEVLKECLQNQDGFLIDEKTKPIGDLGFDSKDGLDFATILTEKIGWHFPDDINPFVIDEPKRCARNVGQIVDLVKELMPK